MPVGNPNFKTDNHPGKITQFSSISQPDSAGRPLGVKNRATIARKILEMSAIVPNSIFEKVKEVFPDIDQRMTAEEIASLVMLGNAIAKGDVNAYKAIMDSAYGAPKNEIDHTTKGESFAPTPIIFTRGAKDE